VLTLAQPTPFLGIVFVEGLLEVFCTSFSLEVLIYLFKITSKTLPLGIQTMLRPFAFLCMDDVGGPGCPDSERYYNHS